MSEPVDLDVQADDGSSTLDVVPTFIKTAEAAELLGLEVSETQLLIRSGVLTGVKAPKAGGWHVDRDQVLAYRAMHAATRGPRRPATITQDQLVKLLGDAQHYGVKADEARQKANEFSAKRHAAVRAMFDGGLSVRSIADLLELSPSVVARMLA